MDLKDKKKMQSIASIAGSLSVLMFFAMNHESPHTKVVTGVVFTIIILLMFIGTICSQKLRNSAGPMFVFLLMIVVATLGNYLDLKKVDDKFLVIILAILFLALPIMSYRAAVKAGDVESMRKSKQSFVKIALAIGFMILMIIIAKVFI